MMENVENTINAVCNWIQEELQKDSPSEQLSETVKALAELVSAKATVEAILM